MAPKFLWQFLDSFETKIFRWHREFLLFICLFCGFFFFFFEKFKEISVGFIICFNWVWLVWGRILWFGIFEEENWMSGFWGSQFEGKFCENEIEKFRHLTLQTSPSFYGFLRLKFAVESLNLETGIILRDLLDAKSWIFVWVTQKNLKTVTHPDLCPWKSPFIWNAKATKNSSNVNQSS